jgi:tRNA threonylcarbamoyl adenosine modification protein YeaZ
VSGLSEERLVLAIETTAPRPGAALARTSGAGFRLLRDEYPAESCGRAEALSAAIAAVFANAGERADAVGGIAVVEGPGSYTRLRVGLGLARGLALVDSTPVVPVGSLALLAEAAPRGIDRVCAVLDAGRSRAYVAGLEREADACGWSEVRTAVEAQIGEVAGIVRAWGGSWCVVADPTLERALVPDVVAPDRRAGLLAAVGARRLESGRAVTASAALPRYVGATGARENRAGIATGRVVLR